MAIRKKAEKNHRVARWFFSGERCFGFRKLTITWAIGEQSRFRKLRIYTCPTGTLTRSLLDTPWQFCTTSVIWDRGPLASQPF
jgi:hypothetical protein